MSTAELATSLDVSQADRLLQAEALVRAFCRWHIAPLRTAVTVTINGSGTGRIFLPTLRLVNVTSIVEDGTAVDLSTVDWFPAGYVDRATPLWTAHSRGVVVTMDHGYDQVPADVQGVVQAVAQRALDNPGSRVRTQVGQVSETYTATGFNQSVPLALIDEEKLILAPYRIPRLG